VPILANNAERMRRQKNLDFINLFGMSYHGKIMFPSNFTRKRPVF
jgi:hypothetical protein